MKLPAKAIQRLLAIKDGTVIAHGYTPSRDTVDIWFDQGKLVRCESRAGFQTTLEASDHFEHRYFHEGIKRWYKGTPEAGFHKRIIDFFDTFGQPLPFTDGGDYNRGKPTE